jgi:hypothetical protein
MMRTLFFWAKANVGCWKPLVIDPGTAHDEGQEFLARLVTNDVIWFQLYVYYTEGYLKLKYRK